MLDAVENRRRITEFAGGREISTATLLEDFGFTGDKLTARIADLSGGERRRLQFLRLLLDEPNVLLLDEPTNDLDIDTLTVIEDYLDGWPGTLIVVTHDRYFLERVTDVTYALHRRRPLRSAARRHRAVPRRPRGRRTDVRDPHRAAAYRVRVGARATRRQGDGPHRRPARQARRADRRAARVDGRGRGRSRAVGRIQRRTQRSAARKESLEEEWLALAED